MSGNNPRATQQTAPRTVLELHPIEQPLRAKARSTARSARTWVRIHLPRLTRWVRIYGGAWLTRRKDETELALACGWPSTAGWLKAVALLIGGTIGLQIIPRAVAVAVGFWRRILVGAHTHTGLLAAVTGPLHAFMAHHAAGLPLTPATAYALWQLAGWALLLMATLRSGVARAAWILYGAATAAMVWSAAPAPARPLAAGMAALLWALASLAALDGLSLRSRVTVITEIRNGDVVATHINNGR